MPSEVRKDWEVLMNRCQEAGLPNPGMCPCRIGKERITVFIDGHISRSSDTINRSIMQVMSYVLGYTRGKEDQAQTESRCWRLDQPVDVHIIRSEN